MYTRALPVTMRCLSASKTGTRIALASISPIADRSIRANPSSTAPLWFGPTRFSKSKSSIVNLKNGELGGKSAKSNLDARLLTPLAPTL